MSDARELDVLQAAWHQNGEPVPAGLQKLVGRQTLFLQLGAAAEILVSVTFLGGSFWLAVTQREPEFVALAAGIWIVTLAAAIYSFQNRTGTWRPAALDTRAFLELSLRRCRASLRAVTFGLYLLLVEVVLLAGWHAWYWAGHPPAPGMAVWLTASCLPAVFLIALLLFRSRKRRELTRLEALHRELN